MRQSLERRQYGDQRHTLTLSLKPVVAAPPVDNSASDSASPQTPSGMKVFPFHEHFRGTPLVGAPTSLSATSNRRFGYRELHFPQYCSFSLFVFGVCSDPLDLASSLTSNAFLHPLFR